MFCMKCGREVGEGQVFCSDCLLEMAKYPVKPGTVVRLPKRREITNSRKAFTWRKTLTPEEQLRKLRRQLRTAVIVGLVMFLLLCAALYPAVLYLIEEDHLLPGQNYSLIDSITPTEE